MQDREQERSEERIPLKSAEEVEQALKEIEKEEQLYSIARRNLSRGFSAKVTNCSIIALAP